MRTAIFSLKGALPANSHRSSGVVRWRICRRSGIDRFECGRGDSFTVHIGYPCGRRQAGFDRKWSAGKSLKPTDLLPDARIRATLDAIGCADIDLGRAPHDLSGGQAARVSLARTLLTSPKVLLADEVDAGLDDENADKVASIMAQAAERGMAVIRIRHRPPDGRATRILTLANGVLQSANAPHTAATNDSNDFAAQSDSVQGVQA